MPIKAYTLTTQQIAQIEFIKERQLILPSLLFLLGNQPLAFASGQLLHLFDPMLSLLFPDQAWTQWAELMSKPAGIERLVDALEK